ncbi:MAG TPA: hypothetical protein VLC46_18255 [Thermoanaerobaculia bacterium]|jgi:hypothetical protein|nr:hypothetical protein [Thermoanaerobaculia bacterium]
MLRRAAIIVAFIALASSSSFGLSNGCNDYDCTADSNGNETCWEFMNGGGNLHGCTMVKQCNGGGGGCITYCQTSFCYNV